MPAGRDGIHIPITGDASGVEVASKRAGAALSKIGTASKASSTQMLNFSRVIQDLPFGLVGIQNNLTQLIPGVGALGLAFTGVITALTFAQVGFGAWTKGLGGVSKKSKEAKEELEAFKEATKEIANAIGEEASRVTSLIAALGSDQLNTKERKKAFEELKTINKDYFGSLKDEQGIIEKLQSAYAGYLQNLVEVGKTKAIESQLTKLFSRKLELELAIDPKFIAATTKSVQNQVGFIKRELDKLGGPVDVKKEAFDPLNKSLQRRIFLTQQLQKAESGEQILFVSGLHETQSEIGNINLQIAGLTKLLADTGTFDIKVDKDKKDKAIRDLHEFAKAWDKIRDDLLKNINKTIGDTPIFDPQSLIPSFDPSAFKLPIATALRDAINKGLTSVTDIKTDSVATTIATQLNLDLIDKFGPMFASIGKNMPEIDLTLSSQTNFENLLKAFNQLNGRAVSFSEILAGLQITDKLRQSAETINGVLTPAFQSLFAAIQQGENPIKAFFESIGQSVQQLIHKLIAAAIQAAILSLITGGAGAASGKGLSFAGAFGKILGLAGGGLISGPTLALVGEGSGTSLSNPEVVTPLNELRNIIGGAGTQRIEIVGRTRGRDLIYSNRRTERSLRRTG